MLNIKLKEPVLVTMSSIELFASSVGKSYKEIYLGDKNAVYEKHKVQSSSWHKYWGWYQYPMLFRTLDGDIALTIDIGNDCLGGAHEQPLCFISKDNGLSWEEEKICDVNAYLNIITLPNGDELYFGDIHQSSWRYFKTALIKKYNLTPVKKGFLDPYFAHKYDIYRYGDLPEEVRGFTIRRKKSGEKEIHIEKGTLNFPELGVQACTQAILGEYIEDLESLALIPQPDMVTASKDGTLFSCIPHLDTLDDKMLYYHVYCVASADGGSIWEKRGLVFDADKRAPWGVCEEISIKFTEAGDLVCVLRSDHGQGDYINLFISHSYDMGYSWTKPEVVSPFGILPALVALDNDVMGLLYGRPGVHLLFSEGSCNSWESHKVLVGTGVEELKYMFGDDWYMYSYMHSCSNATLIKTGPDRFLTAYSDFRHYDEDGNVRKAIKVQEVVVEKL